MKKSKFFMAMAAVAAVISLGSCSKETAKSSDPIPSTGPTPSGLLKPVLTLNPTSVSLSQAAAASTALTLNWTSAVPQGQFIDVTYQVYVNLGSKDLYTSPEIVNAGATLTSSFTGKALNDLAIKLGIAAGQTGSLKIAVYAKPSDISIDGIISDVATVSVTTYSESIDGPAQLYLLGSAVGGWDMKDAQVVPNVGGKTYKIEGVEVRLQPNDVGFKFYFSNNNTDNREVAQDPGSQIFGKAKIFTSDAASLFQPALKGGKTSGIYTLELNLETLMMTMTRTADLPSTVDLSKYSTLYIKGNCVPWKWETPTINLTKTSNNVFEASGIDFQFNEKDPQNPCGFKIYLSLSSWSPYFAMDDASTNGNIIIKQIDEGDAPQFYPGKIGYTSGIYNVKCDFNTMKMTLTKTGSAARVMNVIGDAVGGWVSNENWNDFPKLNETATEGIFSGDVTLDFSVATNGFKLFINGNWTPEYGMEWASTKDNIKFQAKQDPIQAALKNPNHGNDCQFYLGDLGYTSGTYTMTVNVNTGVLTLVKK